MMGELVDITTHREVGGRLLMFVVLVSCMVPSSLALSHISSKTFVFMQCNLRKHRRNRSGIGSEECSGQLRRYNVDSFRLGSSR